jgi:hypothetical protein
MSFLLSSFQFDRNYVDHNLLLKKSFRKSENKTVIFVEQQPNSGLERFVLRFLYNTQWDTHTRGCTPLNEQLAHRRGYYPPNTTDSIDENLCSQRYSNPRSQQSGCFRHKPQTTRLSTSSNNNLLLSFPSTSCFPDGTVP